MLEDLDAYPRIGCSIHLLLRCELFCSPIAQSLSLGYLLAEYDARNFAKALILDAVLANLILKVDKTTSREVSQLVQCRDVVTNIGANLDDSLAR